MKLTNFITEINKYLSTILVFAQVHPNLILLIYRFNN